MKGKRSARERLIVALDLPTQAMALNLVDQLGDNVNFYKVGWRLFLQGGLALVEDLRNQAKDVFLDLKMDDIEETIETSVREIGELAMFLTLQGGAATARAAVRGRGKNAYPKFLSVTLLSSLGEEDLAEIYKLAGIKDEKSFLPDFILHRAEQALSAGCEGLIASGEAIKSIRAKFGEEPIIVSPGIRPVGSSTDDHKRSTTPREAILHGSDYLVVGRPITMSPDPIKAVESILSEMDETLDQRESLI